MTAKCQAMFSAFANIKSFNSYNPKGGCWYFTHSTDEETEDLFQTGLSTVCDFRHDTLPSHQHPQILLFVLP